jgi:hypothetical protein
MNSTIEILEPSLPSNFFLAFMQAENNLYPPKLQLAEGANQNDCSIRKRGDDRQKQVTEIIKKSQL